MTFYLKGMWREIDLLIRERKTIKANVPGISDQLPFALYMQILDQSEKLILEVIMARGILRSFLLLIIAVGISQAQQNGWNPDEIIFDGPTERPAKFPLNPQRPTSWPGNGRTTTPAPTNVVNTTPQATASYNQCYNSCQTTSEYNPVCGSDNVVYSNPGRLGCARNCGRQVQLTRYGQCTDNARG